MENNNDEELDVNKQEKEKLKDKLSSMEDKFQKKCQNFENKAKDYFEKKSNIMEVSVETLALKDVVSWLKANLPKSFKSAFIQKQTSEGKLKFSKEYSGYKYHLYVGFIGENNEVMKTEKSIFYHCNELDQALVSNFGDRDMIIVG